MEEEMEENIVIMDMTNKQTIESAHVLAITMIVCLEEAGGGVAVTTMEAEDTVGEMAGEMAVEEEDVVGMEIEEDEEAEEVIEHLALLTSKYP